jgi:hypothetical protein
MGSIFDMERFWHLVWTNLTSYTFSFLLFLIPLYIFQIFDVFINKVLQAYIITCHTLEKTLKRTLKPIKIENVVVTLSSNKNPTIIDVFHSS